MKFNEIIAKYTCGEATLEDTNAALKEAGANFHLDPTKNILSAEDILNGYGLLDTGTGTMDPARMTDGKLVNVDCGDSYALFFHDGKVYEVKGKDLFLK